MKVMGIKHLSKIENILISAEEPITAWGIQRTYAKQNKGCALHLSILLEALEYLKEKNKIETTTIDKGFRKVLGYKWVG